MLFWEEGKRYKREVLWASAALTVQGRGRVWAALGLSVVNFPQIP